MALAFFAPAAVWAGAGHVVVVVIDGPRHTEFLDEPGMPHAQKLGTVLIPAGTRVTNFQNQNQTVTMVGHGTMLTGTEQPLANDGTERPDQPTLFELIRKERALPQSAVHLVAGKDKLAAVSYSTHPLWGAAYGATVDAAFRQDPATYAAAVSAITSTPRPVFTLINFASVDLAGHSGVWIDYLNALVQADSLVNELWNVIEADPILAGDTDLFVVADHGRHDDAHGGFTNHGDTCMGCRMLPFVAIGPDIRMGETGTLARVQEDLAPTIAEILGLNPPIMDGFIMSEILVNGQIGVAEVPPARPLLRAWPNPSRGSVTVEGVLSAEESGLADFNYSSGAGAVVELAEGAPRLVDVFSVDGRRVISSRPVTAWPWRWDGRDDASRPVPTGAYWIRVQSAVGPAGAVQVTLIR